MFYSQFILAKKGPLGTIWIAAHLERKLRKNQVADTDIGVSVDSILFPDVPIALRLSSHLLLGVVKIYSRKVNYLFHDCSEALLKIKQAFRSTAVDLPPEESTAPYHSITLPETFDLDDFELPDSAFLQGNFVDHHISTREQITLQDSVDGVGYSTSQFGLDERFGDGDASQIRLDLDEDLFLDKNSSPKHTSVPLGTKVGAVHEGQPSIPPTNMDIDEGQNGCDEHNILETSKDLSELLSNDCDKYVLSSAENLKRNVDSSHRHGYNIQTPDLNEVFFPGDHIDGPSAVSDYIALAADEAPSPDLFECAQAPSTPGLVEEAIPANVQKIPVLSPQEKTSSPNAVEVINTVSSISPHMDFEGPDATNNNDLGNGIRMEPKSADNAQSVSSHTSVLTEPKPLSLALEYSGGFLAAPVEAHLECGQKSEDNLQSGFICYEVNNLPIVHDNVEAVHPEVAFLDGLLTASCSHEASNLETPPNKSTADNVVVVTSNDTVLVPGVTSEINNTSLENKADSSILFNKDPIKDVDSCLTSKPSALSSNLCLRPCNSLLDQANVLSLEDGALLVNASEFFHREPTCISEIPSREEALHVSGSSIEVQGEDNCIANVTDTVQEMHHKSEFALSEFISVVNKPDEQFTGLISKDTALRSDIYTRPCNSLLDQVNILSLEDGALGVSAPEFSHTKPTCISETPSREEALHVSGSSIEVQGEVNHTANVTDTVQEVHQNSEFVLSEFKSVVNKPDELSTDLISKYTQLDNLNCPSSSKYPEPEKLLLASTGDFNMPNHLGQLTAEKRVDEFAGNVDRISNLCGKKHRLMDSTPVLQNVSSAKMSGLPGVRRNSAYIPDDDDILASILVGRTPILGMGPTPPPPKIASRKRPRLTQRVGVPKRKVLLDDTMVLHADAIRQQLLNTEDIRRMRKKAPCTRLETWMIQKSSIEEEFFSESLFTGISTELSSLHTRRYDVNENPGSQIDEQHSDEHYLYVELSKEMDHSRNTEFVRESSGKEMGELITVMADRVDGGMLGPFGTSVSIKAQSCKDAAVFDAPEKLGSRQHQLEPSCRTVSTVGVNVHERVDGGMQGLFGTSVSIEAQSCKDAAAFDGGIQGPFNTSVSIEAQSCKDAAVFDAQEKLGSRQHQLEPLSKIVSTVGVNDHERVDGGIQGPFSTSVSIEAQSCNDAATFDAQEKLGSRLPQLEPSSKTVAVSTVGINVHERVGDEMPLLSALHSGNEHEIPIYSRIEETFTHKINKTHSSPKKSDAISMHQDQEFLHELVQTSDKLAEMDDRTSNFAGSAVEDVASAKDATRCMIVDSMEFTAVNVDTVVRAEDTSIAKDASISEEGNTVDVVDLNCPQYSHDVGKIENGEILVSMLDKCLLEDRAGLPADSSTVIVHANSPIPDMAAKSCEPTELATVTGNLGMEEIKDGLEVALEGELVVERVPADEGRPTSEIVCSENPQAASPFPHQCNTETENVPSAAGENSGLQECNLEGVLDAESAPMDFDAARESSDFCSAIDDNDTEFLNADGEADFDEAADNDVQNPEAAQLHENSGWSTRTKGVVRYLKTLFDEEYGRGKKVVAVDHLLAGKTRKEASRMFFETLVLKTRDYIDVEQENPFDCINIKPRPKLLSLSSDPPLCGERQYK